MILSSVALTSLFFQCAPDVSPMTLQALVTVESGGNPYVIANVSNGTSHYFDSKEKAVSFADKLAASGKRYSVGLMQIYSGNFKSYDLSNKLAFDACQNIRVGADILKKCFARASSDSNDEQNALRKAFSCYYSNNFTTGFKVEENGSSYVSRIEGEAKKLIVPDIKVYAKDGEGKINKSMMNESKSWDVFGDFN